MDARRFRFLAAATVLLASASAAAPETEYHRLGRKVEPLFQAVTLDLDADKPVYSGRTQVDLRVNEKVSSFRLLARDMNIEEASLEELVAEGGAPPVKLSHRTLEDGSVAFEADEPIKPGRYTLQIRFSNDFDTRATGLYRLDVGGHGYAFTQFEANDAQSAFPSWDEPEFKIPYQLTLKVPEAHTAASNTHVQSVAVKGGVKTVTCEKTKPLPSYLLAIATGPLETLKIEGMSVPGNVVTAKGQIGLGEDATRVAGPLLTALERYFGRPYPYEKLDLIAAPEFWPGAMENAGAIVFADRLLLMDPAAAGVEQRRLLVEVTAHEMAHMWFGDLVTMKWWDDLWLNESFASWMGDKVSAEVYPEFHTALSTVRSADEAMLTDARRTTRAIRQQVTTLDNLLQSADVLAYNKGQAVLGMIEGWLGEDVFRKGIRSYVDEHAWGNAEGADLWTALSKASGKDVAGPMSSFLDQPGVPVVRVEPLAGGKARVTQKRFTNFGFEPEAPALWQIPVRLEYPDGDGLRTQAFLLAEPEKIVALDSGRTPEWIHPNAGETGYYRWEVPDEELLAMAREATARLTPRERLGFLLNASALLDAGLLGGPAYLATLETFSQDANPDVVRGLLVALEKVRDAFVTDSLEGQYAAYVRRILAPSLRRFGADPSPGEDDSVGMRRPFLVAMMADEGGDRELRRLGAERARAYMRDTHSVDASMAATWLSVAALDGDEALFEEFKKRFEATTNPSERVWYLTALGKFESPEILRKALDYSLSGPLRPQEVTLVARAAADHPRFDETVFSWLTGNYKEIVARIPPMRATFLPHQVKRCSEDIRTRAVAFFSEPGNMLPGMDKEIAKMSEAVRDCEGLRTREGAAVAAYLTRGERAGGAAAAAGH